MMMMMMADGLADWHGMDAADVDRQEAACVDQGDHSQRRVPQGRRAILHLLSIYSHKYVANQPWIHWPNDDANVIIPFRSIRCDADPSIHSTMAPHCSYDFDCCCR